MPIKKSIISIEVLSSTTYWYHLYMKLYKYVQSYIVSKPSNKK